MCIVQWRDQGLPCSTREQDPATNQTRLCSILYTRLMMMLCISFLDSYSMLQARAGPLIGCRTPLHWCQQLQAGRLSNRAAKAIMMATLSPGREESSASSSIIKSSQPLRSMGSTEVEAEGGLEAAEVVKYSSYVNCIALWAFIQVQTTLLWRMIETACYIPCYL